MKKLNNKGISIIEILLCFVLAALITVSLYNILDTISSTRNIEEQKLEIQTQKSQLTKRILGDIVEYGLQSISINGSKKAVSKTVTDTPKDLYASNCNVFDAEKWTCVNNSNYTNDARTRSNTFYSDATSVQVVTFNFKNGITKELRILKQVNNYNIESAANHYGDKFFIGYGEPTELITTVGVTPNPFKKGTIDSIDFDSFGYETRNDDKIYQTKIGNINIDKSNDFLKLDIRFDNPNVKQRYGIYIITPTSIDQAYVNTLDDLDIEENSANEIEEFPIQCHGFELDELVPYAISLDKFKDSFKKSKQCDANYCYWSTDDIVYKEKEEEPEPVPVTPTPEPTDPTDPTETVEPEEIVPEEPDEIEPNVFDNLVPNTPLIISISTEAANHTTDNLFLNNKGYMANALSVIDYSDKIINNINFAWNNNTRLHQTSMQHELIQDSYEYTTDADGNNTGRKVIDNDPSWNKNLYIGTGSGKSFQATTKFRIRIDKRIVDNMAWSEDDFYIQIYGVIKPDPNADEDDGE